MLTAGLFDLGRPFMARRRGRDGDRLRRDRARNRCHMWRMEPARSSLRRAGDIRFPAWLVPWSGANRRECKRPKVHIVDEGGRTRDDNDQRDSAGNPMLLALRARQSSCPGHPCASIPSPSFPEWLRFL